MRILLPALLTLPSNTVDTFSCLPIWRMSSVLPLKTKTDVRAGTRNPLIWDKAVHKSSVIPSPRYSFSLSGLMLTKGNTATPAAGGGSGLLFQIITPTVAAKASDNANSSAVVGLRRTHFFPRVRPQCAGPESARGATSVQDLRPVREPTSNDAWDLSRGISGKSSKGRDLLSDSTGAVAAARYLKPAGRFQMLFLQQRADDLLAVDRTRRQVHRRLWRSLRPRCFRQLVPAPCNWVCPA